MIGILYFSSTGNSLYIAQRVKNKMGGQIKYIPSYEGDGSEFEQIILVTPIYSYGMPTFVYDLIPKLNKTTELIVIQNYGGMVGGADYYIYEYAMEHKLNIKAVYAIKMPENFTLTFTVPKFYLKSVLKGADKKIDNVINGIKSGNYRIPKKCKTKKEAYLKNKSNWHLIGEDFSVTENCTKCGKCISVCPAKNIDFRNGKIVFSNKCVACLGCYHRCPQKAIIYKGKTKKDRYINPYVNENNIGKDI
jgi:ferredoxin